MKKGRSAGAGALFGPYKDAALKSKAKKRVVPSKGAGSLQHSCRTERHRPQALQKAAEDHVGRQDRFMTRALICGAAVIGSLSSAHAQVCAPRKVSATGATAQFAILGKVAARTAWSTKVGNDPRIGPAYSTWLRGKERRIVCRKVDRRHVCLAIALPCRSSGLFAAPAKPPTALNPKQRPL
jgi:hypothetical protein